MIFVAGPVLLNHTLALRPVTIRVWRRDRASPCVGVHNRRVSARHLTVTFALAAGMALAVLAQTPSFEVASIKPNPSGRNGGRIGPENDLKPQEGTVAVIVVDRVERPSPD